MRKISGLLAGAAACLLAVSGQAATYLTFSNGSGVFGNDQTASPSFSDSFDLGTFAAGRYLFSGTISSAYQGSQASDQDLDFSSVSLNGTPFQIGSQGQFEFRYVADVPSGAVNMLNVVGTAGVRSTYSGTIYVSPDAVPEVSTWTLMMLGFGAVGFAMRRSARYDRVRA